MTLATQDSFYGVAGARCSVRNVSTQVYVSDDPYAKLSYYLSCIHSISGIDFENLIDFQKYYCFDSDDKNKIVIIAKLFQPQIFLQINAMVMTNNEVAFYEVNNQSFAALTNGEVVVGQYRGRIISIMAVNQQWLKKNYYDPLESISSIARRPIYRRSTFDAPRVSTETCKCSCSECLSCKCVCCKIQCCEDIEVCTPCANDDEFSFWNFLFLLFCMGVPGIGFLIFIWGVVAEKWKLKLCGFYGFIVSTIIYLIVFLEVLPNQ